MVKCPYCNKEFDAQPSGENIIWKKVNGRRYAHIKCLEGVSAETLKEEQDIDALYKYIKNILGDDLSYVKFKRQIDQYHKELGYTYTGMLSSLKWYYEVEQMGQDKDKAHSGVGIIPYIYNDARKYYYRIYIAQQKNKEIINYEVPTKTITIQSPRMFIPPPHLWFEDEEIQNIEEENE